MSKIYGSGKVWLKTSLLLLFLFVIYTTLVLKGFFIGLDKNIDLTLPYKPDGILYFISKIIAYLYFILIPVILAIILYLIRRKQKIEALLLALSFSGWVISELILKLIFRIPCPPTYYENVLAQHGWFQFSFIRNIAMMETCYPSSHTVTYIVLLGYLSFLTLVYVKITWLRPLLIFGLVSIICLVGPSRIYLHVHWLSDIIAGYLLGLGLLILLILIRNRYLQKRIAKRL